MEPDIAPLAKRLAEENNVNWRQLNGSGPSGRVVERDVLEYLARVMAGEEAIDPTPEPFLEGMAQWPGQDAPRPSAADSYNDFDEVRFAEPETSLASDATPRAEVPLIAEVEPPRNEPVIDEAIFLFDDEEVEPSVAAPPDVWEDVGVLATEEKRLPSAADDAPQGAGFGGLDSESLDSQDAGDWKNLVERDEVYQTWSGLATRPVAVEAVQAAVEAKSDEAMPRVWDEVGLEVLAESDLGGQVWAEPSMAERQATEQLVAKEPPAPEILAPLSAPPAATLVSGALPLMSYGVLLRQHIDLTALADAQRAVGRELSGGTPIPPTAFLLRAAAKALRREPLGPDRSVALAVLSKRGLGARRFDKAELLSFRELVAAVNEARASETTELEPAALLVADLSEFALDEAVLRTDLPVLTLGRVLYDSQEGGYHSTLSLSGEFVTAVGAKLLGEVAVLLDSPVQLLL